jgi:hypothetical protein
LRLREAIEEFAATEPAGKGKKTKVRGRPGQVPDGLWENLGKLVPVFTTFSNATS